MAFVLKIVYIGRHWNWYPAIFEWRDSFRNVRVFKQWSFYNVFTQDLQIYIHVYKIPKNSNSLPFNQYTVHRLFHKNGTQLSAWTYVVLQLSTALSSSFLSYPSSVAGKLKVIERYCKQNLSKNFERREWFRQTWYLAKKLNVIA